MGAALRLVGDTVEAEEAVHDTFMKIWDRIDSYEPDKGRLFTWMVRICRNTCLDRLKSARNKRQSRTDNPVDLVSATGPSHSTTQNTDTIGVKEWMDVLNPDQRQVIETLYFQGMSQSQAADELDIPLGTVKTRLRTGLRTIREKLGLT